MFTGLPSGVVPYVAILAARVSACVHLSLAPRVRGFDRTEGVVVRARGRRVPCGVAVYFTRYWRREFYLVGAAFALAQVAAFVAMGGPVNQMAIASKTAEVAFGVAATYPHFADDPAAE